MMNNKGKILVVDDEEDIRTLINIFLSNQGYKILEAADGYKAIEIIKEESELDLVILDIMMPHMSGIEACSEIRKISSVPILFLTAKSQEPDKNEAYENGGDDFLSKPFSKEDLVRKVYALIRRYNIYKGKEDGQTGIRILGDINIDTLKHTVVKNGEPLRLTEKEYALLAFLAEHRGQPWSLEELYENVWKEKYLSSSSNTVMVHVLRLRQKIETDPAQPKIVRTVYGKGYQVD